MRSRIRFMVVAFAVCIAASIAIAGQKHIEVVSKGFQVDFWQQVNRGCNDAGKEFGATVRFVGPASEANIAEQIEQLSNAVNKKPDAICFAPLSPQSSMDLIYQAGDAGIPVVTFDSDIHEDTGGAVRAFVATDNKQAGGVAAEEMFKAIGPKLVNASQPIHIGVLSQDTTSESVADRTIGFITRMIELCGAENTSVEGHVKYEKRNAGAKVILNVGIPAETTDSQMNTVVQTIFNKPNLAGAYASNEFAAKGMVNVDESLGILGPGKVVGIGFDSGIVQVSAVRDRTLYGSITQDPYMIGYSSVKTAIEATEGKKVENISVPFHFYTAANMDRPEIKACLYE